MYELSPGKAIVPIVKINHNREILELLGTAFLVGSHPYAVTAKHVFLDAPLQKGEMYGIICLEHRGRPRIVGNFMFVYAEEFDIAVFPVEGIVDYISLSISSHSITNTEDVVTWDFSSTLINTCEDNNKKIHIYPKDT